MARRRRLVFVVIASMPVFFAAPAWSSSSTVVIESTFVNISTNRLTITGSDFKPSSTAPKVNLDNNVLVVVSSTDTKVVATLPSGLHTGFLYRLGVTNSSGQAGASTVTLPGPGQTFLANFGGYTEGPYSYYLAIIGSFWGTGGSVFSIMPVPCTIDAMYASVVASGVTSPFSVTLQQNYQSTSLQCQVLAGAPGSAATACPLPDPPISVSAGDTVDYLVVIPPASTQPSFNMSLALHCQ